MTPPRHDDRTSGLCIPGSLPSRWLPSWGVLPLGLSVQKQNREDTIIDQEGQQWINILKNGQGWGDPDELPGLRPGGSSTLNGIGGVQGPAVYGFRGPFFSDTVPQTKRATDNAIISLAFLSVTYLRGGFPHGCNRVWPWSGSISGSQNSQMQRSLAHSRTGGESVAGRFSFTRSKWNSRRR